MNLLIDIRLPNEGDRTNRDLLPWKCVESPGPAQDGAGWEGNRRRVSKRDQGLIVAAQAGPGGACA